MPDKPTGPDCTIPPTTPPAGPYTGAPILLGAPFLKSDPPLAGFDDPCCSCCSGVGDGASSAEGGGSQCCAPPGGDAGGGGGSDGFLRGAPIIF